MPQKGKRLRAHTKASSAKRIKSSKGASENGSEPDKDISGDSVCARCAELKIADLLSALERKERFPGFSNIVVQRLLFDSSQSLLPTCSACTGFEKVITWSWYALQASRIYQRGLPLAESQTLCSKSWFQLERGKPVRCTKQAEYDRVSAGISVASAVDTGNVKRTNPLVQPLYLARQGRVWSILTTPQSRPGYTTALKLIPNVIPDNLTPLN
jgi:hypothetical protein